MGKHQLAQSTYLFLTATLVAVAVLIAMFIFTVISALN